jgi:hypothetical protein
MLDIVKVEWAKVQLVLQNLEAHKCAIHVVPSQIESQTSIPVFAASILVKRHCHVYSPRFLEYLACFLFVIYPWVPLNPAFIPIHRVALAYRETGLPVDDLLDDLACAVGLLIQL